MFAAMRSRYALIISDGWTRFTLDNERIRSHPATYYKYFPVQGGTSMAQCEKCGNEYDKTFEVVIAGKAHVFDSFECAVATLAPTCRHCGCRIIGHGVEVNGAFYCCANCAAKEGAQGVRDRI